ncbi:MAG: hypothetical protein JNG88_09885 [Phycisphaerales bacterium]|nr:hypothetical protein [Phycisphaerales bacterium]
MSEIRHERETLEALERMGRAAPGRSPSKKPGLAESAAQSAPPPPKPLPDESRIEHRCLSCGYPLMVAERTRCSECGASYSSDMLGCWFSGGEQSRLETILWLVRLVFVLKFLLIPVAIGFYWPLFSSVLWLGDLAAVAWMLVVAAQRRWREVGARYSIVGLHLIGILLLVELQLSGADTSQITYHIPAAYAALEAGAGLLLLISLHRRESGIQLAGGKWTERLCMVGIITIPILAFVISRFVYPSGVGAFFSGVATFGVSLPSVISYLLNIALWSFVWHRVYRLRNTLFPQAIRRAAH